MISTSPGAVVSSVRETIRTVRKLISEALAALKTYDLDTAQRKVSEAAIYLDKVSSLIEKLEEYARVKSGAR